MEELPHDRFGARDRAGVGTQHNSDPARLPTPIAVCTCHQSGLTSQARAPRATPEPWRPHAGIRLPHVLIAGKAWTQLTSGSQNSSIAGWRASSYTRATSSSTTPRTQGAGLAEAPASDALDRRSRADTARRIAPRTREPPLEGRQSLRGFAATHELSHTTLLGSEHLDRFIPQATPASPRAKKRPTPRLDRPGPRLPAARRRGSTSRRNRTRRPQP